MGESHQVARNSSCSCEKSQKLELATARGVSAERLVATVSGDTGQRYRGSLTSDSECKSINVGNLTTGPTRAGLAAADVVVKMSDFLAIGDHICLYCEETQGYVYSWQTRLVLNPTFVLFTSK